MGSSSGVVHDFQSTAKKRLSAQPQQAVPIIPQLAPIQASGKIVEGKAERILDLGEEEECCLVRSFEHGMAIIIMSRQDLMNRSSLT